MHLLLLLRGYECGVLVEKSLGLPLDVCLREMYTYGRFNCRSLLLCVISVTLKRNACSYIIYINQIQTCPLYEAYMYVLDVISYSMMQSIR